MFSAAPRHPRFAVPHQCSESDETEITPLGSPGKARALMYILLFSFLPKGESTSWPFPPNCEQCQVEGEGLTSLKWMTYPTCFNADILTLSLPGLLQLSNWFQEFFKGCLDYILLSWHFCRGMKPGASCFAILLVSLKHKVSFYGIS